MGDTAHLLEASITSALALKPSTVYVVRVENRASRNKWHLRKCFSEFSELREKVIGLIESTAGASVAVGASKGSPATPHSVNSSVYDTGGSHTSRSSSGSSDVMLAVESSASFSERFPYLFKQFPRRQFFGSRSKKVIEQRTRSLNAFVHQLLLYAREVRQQNQIAVYFGLRGFVETFFECTEHSAVFSASSPCFPFAGLSSPSTLAKTQAAAAAAARAAAVVVVGAHGTQRRPGHAPFSFRDDSDGDSDEENDDVRRDLAPASTQAPDKRGVPFARRFYQEYGKATASCESDGDDDDEENKLVGLKKTASCLAHRELREMKMHFTGSHYAPLQATGAAGAPDAWAARVEIAGIPSTAGRVHQPQPQPHSAALAISANRVQQAKRSSGEKKRAGADEVLRWPADEPQRQTPAASIVYAAPRPEASCSSAGSASKTLFSKDPSGSDRQPTKARRAMAAREQRPEWA
ncbi:hypothetical protein PybrP1_009614 [[Pythium] brassicae (nom. inval.)]|nr:hypothetical protein PybrP1_009614 [[Pythium] brassicae (nom. inval.)]